MCGICGVRKFGDVPIPEEMVTLLILNQMNRGLEAAGVALQDKKGHINVLRNNVTPYQFVSSQEYKDFMKEHLTKDTIIALGHARKATLGTPRVLSNNHPMYAGQTAVVHNGHINNHDWAFKEWKLDRKAETDSDIFRAILDKEGFTYKATEMMCKLSGSAAIAAISSKYPGKLLLCRSGNPVQIAVTANQHLMFSSETGPLYKAMRPYRKVFGITMREMTPKDYFMIGMEDNSAWLLGVPKDNDVMGVDADWLEWHHKFTVAHNYTAPNYTCHAQFHGGREKFYEDRPVDVVKCPGCPAYMSVAPAMLTDLKRITCRNCGSKLG